MNARFNKFFDAHNILEENQAGFPSGYSTMDHIFVSHALTEIAKTQKGNCSVRLLILAKHLILYGELGYGKNY